MFLTLYLCLLLDKEGVIAFPAFLQLLELQGVRISAEEKPRLLKQCKGGKTGTD